MGCEGTFVADSVLVACDAASASFTPGIRILDALIAAIILFPLRWRVFPRARTALSKSIDTALCLALGAPARPDDATHPRRMAIYPRIGPARSARSKPFY